MASYHIHHWRKDQDGDGPVSKEVVQIELTEKDFGGSGSQSGNGRKDHLRKTSKGRSQAKKLFGFLIPFYTVREMSDLLKVFRSADTLRVCRDILNDQFL